MHLDIYSFGDAPPPFGSLDIPAIIYLYIQKVQQCICIIFFGLAFLKQQNFQTFFVYFQSFYKPDIKFKIHTCDIFAAFVFYLDDGCWVIALAFLVHIIVACKVT